MKQLWRLLTSSHLQHIMSSKDYENLEKSLCAREKGQKSVLDACDLQWVSGRTALKTCHGNYCVGSETPFCSPRRLHKFRLKLNQEKLHMKMIQKGWSTVRLIEVLNYFWKKMDILFSSLKRKGTIRHVISNQFKSLHLWIGALHIWKGMINAKRYIQVLE